MARYIQIRNGRIYEHERIDNWFSADEDRQVTDASRMTFPTGRRSYYQVGDYIFNATMSPDMAALQYQEFASRLDAEYTLGDFVMYLLDLSEIKVTAKILDISGSGTSARVTLQPYLKISDSELLEIHYRNGRTTSTRSYSDFSESFMWAHIYAATWIWIPIGQAVMTIATLPFGGAARVGASRVLAPLMRRFALRMLRRLFRLGGSRLVRFVAGRVARRTVQIAAKIARDTVVNVVRGYYAELRRNQLRGRVDPAFIRTIDMDRIVREAVRDAVAENITGEIVEGIEGIVPGGGSGLIEASVRDRITAYVTRKILTTSLTPITQLMRSSIEAVDFTDDQRSYSTRLQEHYRTQLERRFSGGEISDLVSGAVRDICANPNLILGG